MSTALSEGQPLGCPDPDLLLAQYRKLVDAHPHMHAPEAAARLGVSEAVLVAARVGHGALWLSTDLARLLGPLPQWGKVLIASRLRLGVVLSILYAQECVTDAESCLVTGPEHAIRIRREGIAGCVLLEDHDAHGHTYSLNWFDAAGDAMGRVYLFSKGDRKAAIEHLQAHAIAGYGRQWTASRGNPATTHAQDSAQVDRHPSGRIVATNVHAARLAGHALTHAGKLSGVRMTCTNHALTQQYCGPLGKTWGDWPALHAADAGIKLHTHLQHITTAEHGIDPSGQPLLRFADEDGATLEIQPVAGAASPASWVSHVLAMEGAA
jgi:hypothetical protein